MNIPRDERTPAGTMAASLGFCLPRASMIPYPSASLAGTIYATSMPKIDKIDAAMDKIGELDVKAVNKVVGLLGTSEIFTNKFQGALREFPALVKEGSKALNLLSTPHRAAANRPGGPLYILWRPSAACAARSSRAEHGDRQRTRTSRRRQARRPGVPSG